MPTGKWIGRSMQRTEDRRLLTGDGKYVDDIDLDDILQVAFVRSPHAHAHIRSIDVAAAAALEGVLAVHTGADLGDVNRPIPSVLPGNDTVKTQYPLASDIVRYVGESVAVVVAESRYQAEDALDHVFVEYETQPAIVDVVAAAQDDAPRVHDDRPDNIVDTLHQVAGSPLSTFSEAEHALSLTLTIHRGATQPIEPRGVAAVSDGRRLTVWTSTQRPHRVADVIAQMLDVDQGRIRVVTPDVGGGFGPKGNVYPEEIVVAWLAFTLDRPVKWIEDRREHFLTTLHERDQVHHIDVAFTSDGHVLALRDRFVHDAGAYAPYGLAATANTVRHLPGPYRVRHLDITGRSIYTNAVPTGPNRGAGRPQGCFVMERVMDAVARTLGMAPDEVRQRNFVLPAQMPYETGITVGGRAVCYDSGDYPAAFEAALNAIDVSQFRAKQTEMRSQGRYLGMGVAAYTESTGHGPFESARARLAADGRIHVHTGTAAQGQGHETTFAQICADAMGTTPAAIVVKSGDTGQIERGIGTFSSRSTILGGSAVRQAGLSLRERILNVSSAILEVAPDDLELTASGVAVRGASQRVVDFAEIARTADVRGIELDVTETFEPVDVAWASGAMAIIVEVDPESWFVDVRRIVFVHDCGTVINPALVEGQIVGGVVQALGGTLLEKIVYDDSGQLLTASFMDYLLPTSMSAPDVEILHVHSPSPYNPLGVKGAGEGGVMPVAPAVVQAIEDALDLWNVTLDRVPLFPEDIWLRIDVAAVDNTGNYR